MNQLGTTLLYLSHLFHSIQLSLLNRTAKDRLPFIHRTSHAPNLIHKLCQRIFQYNSTSDWLYGRFLRLCGQNSQKRNDLTSILVVDFFTETGQLKMVFYEVAFLYIHKEIILHFKIYGITLFCPNVNVITISSAHSLQWKNTNHTKIKTRIFRLGELSFFQFISLF